MIHFLPPPPPKLKESIININCDPRKKKQAPQPDNEMRPTLCSAIVDYAGVYSFAKGFGSRESRLLPTGRPYPGADRSRHWDVLTQVAQAV